MPLQQTSGAASYEAFGGGVAAVPKYIEEYFSTFLYSSTSGTNNTITNGIDLSTKGGMVWVKSRTRAGSNNYVLDTVRGSSSGNTKALVTNTTAAQSSGPNLDYMTFNTNGFTANAVSGGGELGTNAYYGDFASWSFAKAPKFFDVVTYTGDGVLGKTIAHNLGSVPGCIIIKKTSATGSWIVYHRQLNGGSTPENYYVMLQSTATQAISSNMFNSTAPTSTNFTVGDAFNVNEAGATYVAYLFAHNAGGFGLTGTDNVISCGSFTTDATTGNATVNLGFEPQWILTKMADGLSDWTVYDNMRGMSLTNSYELFPNSSSSEQNYGSPDIFPSATGFSISYVSGSGQYGKNKNIIYIAIRRGPMKVPTSGTSVFSPVSQASHGTVTTNFPVDLSIATPNALATNKSAIDRLRGNDRYLWTNSTNADGSYGSSYTFNYANNTGFVDTYFNSGFNIAYWNFRRAPSFFDEVCWTGTSADQTLNHNLAAIPELIIYKRRGSTGNWYIGCTFTSSDYLNLNVNLTNAGSTVAYSGGGPFSGQPTTTQFSVGQFYSTTTMVAYLFATCPGVSKVGSYTGTGATQTISCGFTGGARFVLVKRTDSTGDWYVWDTARGMVSGTDPSLLLNSTAAEVNADSIYTTTGGFQIVSTAADINASGGTYIFLAIA